jgi:adenosylcobinamide-GDP ribazoletransferase
MVYYPLIGTFIGLTLWGLSVLLGVLFPVPVVSVLLLVSALLVTGGLHMDGWADLIDGLSGSYNREDALRIFKDPHVGSMAVAGVVLILLLKYACLNTLSQAALRPALVLMATLSRYAMVQLACFSPYARATGGVGEPFVRGIRLEHHIAAALRREYLALWRSAACVSVCSSAGNARMQTYFCQRLGGITGDVLGATNELNEPWCFS